MAAEASTTCKICAIEHGAHNFSYVGELGGTHYYYTCPAKSKVTITTPERYHAFKGHLLEAQKRGRWILIFDFHGMRPEHYCSYDFIKNLSGEFVSENKDSLMEIWILHPNSWLATALKVIRPFFRSEILARVNILKGNGMELILNLEKRGLCGKALDWVAREAVF